MFMPISQYYASPAQKSTRLRKKELKPHNAYQNEENASQQRSMNESPTQSSITTTPQYVELSSTSSSAVSATEHSFENSNTNRI